MKANNACGPDVASPKLLNCAGKDLILSLLSQFSMSAARNSVPCSRKTMKQINRIIDLFPCLLCVPGELMGHVVATIIANHISEYNICHSH